MPELDCRVFLIPGDARKNEQDHVCVLNSVARSIIERCRGKYPTAVFTFRGKPLRSVNNTAWAYARKRAIAKYEGRLGEPPPEGFRKLHEYDRILDFSTPVTGTTFFAPSIPMLTALGD